MLKLGLTAAELVEFDLASVGNVQVRTRVEVWDLDHNPLLDVSDMFQSGQANDDTSSDVTTSASLELFDPTYEAGFDDASNVGASQPPNRIIHVERSIFVDALGRFVACPVLTGVVVKIDRDDDVLKLEMQSKDSGALRPLWTPYVVKKNTNKITAIQKIMADCRGEQFFNLGSTTATLKSTLSIGTDTSPWAAATEIAKSLGRILFYDADGVLQCRAASAHPDWAFTSGPGGNLVTVPQRGYDSDGVINAVRFKGGTPRGKKHPVTASAVAPASHPCSPAALATNGVPDYRWADVSIDSVTSKKGAEAAADSSLAAYLIDSVALTFDGLVQSRLEPGDVVRVETGSVLADLRYATGSRPFGLGVASYGYTARVSKPLRSK